VVYLAMIPLSAYRYLAEERKAARSAKAQSGKGQGSEEIPAAQESSPGSNDQVVRLRAKP
jgi:hypothetical protein